MPRLRFCEKSALSCSGRHTYLPNVITDETETLSVPKAFYGDVTGPAPVALTGVRSFEPVALSA